MNSKISILLIGPFPEPLSGVSIANQVVNEVLSEDSQFEVDLINTSYSRFDEEIGKFSIKKAFLIENFPISSSNLEYEVLIKSTSN